MVITGFHSIEEKLRSSVIKTEKSKSSDKSKAASSEGIKLFYSRQGPRVKKILALAKEAGFSFSQVEDSKLDEMVSGLDISLQDHRGIVMEFSDNEGKSANIIDFDAWIKKHSGEEASACTVVILDNITDPHNVGAIIRSCDQFGAALVIIPEHKSASNIGGNDVIGRTSAGASAWVPVAIVNNLVRAVDQLKKAGFWIYGADAGGQDCRKIDFPQKSVIVMGSEGTGISQLLEKQCDTIVSIPTCGKIDSLNVSVAAGVLLYEISRR